MRNWQVLRGNLAQSVPDAVWGQGFSVGTGLHWEQGWEQESVVRWDRSLFGDQVVLHKLKLNSRALKIINQHP